MKIRFLQLALTLALTAAVTATLARAVATATVARAVQPKPHALNAVGSGVVVAP